MSDRRSLLVALIALSLCVSIWHISMQQSQLTEMLVEQQPYAAQLIGTPDAAASASALPLLATAIPATPSLPSTLALPLPANDSAQLIDLRDFAFDIDQPVCAGTGQPNTTVDVLIIVHSAPDNQAKRSVIRETWASSWLAAPHTRLFFLLGTVPGNASAQQRIVDENTRHSDIVQANFVDAYRNMTYKHAAALKWFVYNCPRASYLLKTDDDVFVHARNAAEFLRDRATPRRELLLCKRQQNVRISRSYRSKWRVGNSVMKGRYYPDYCPGYSIVYSADVVARLYREAQQRPFFWIDDVHVTGTLAQAAGLSITPFKSVDGLFLEHGRKVSLLQGGPPTSVEDATAREMFVFTEPNLKAEEIRGMWRAVGNGTAGR